MLHCLATSWHCVSIETQESSRFQATRPQKWTLPYVSKLHSHPAHLGHRIEQPSSKKVLGKCTTGFAASVLSPNHQRECFPRSALCCQLVASLSESPWSWAKKRHISAGGRIEVWKRQGQHCLPGTIHLARVALHLDGDPGWGLWQPVLLRDSRTHLGWLTIVTGWGCSHFCLSQVWCSVGTLE